MYSSAGSLADSNGGVVSFNASSGETTIQVTPYSTTERKVSRRSSDMTWVAQKVEHWIETGQHNQSARRRSAAEESVSAAEESVSAAEKHEDGQNVANPLLKVVTVTGDNVQKKKSFCCWSVKIPCVCLIICSVVVVSLLAGLCYVCFVDSHGPPCEESWIWVGGRCYYFSDVSKSWNGSLEFCSTHGSTLVVLTDPKIQKTIKRYRENVNYWIGLSMNQDGQWMWTNGALYNGSMDNQNNSHLRCAFLNSHLGVLDCTTRRQWICVKDSAW